MVFVKKDKDENKDSMLRKFVKTFLEENIIDEYKKRLYYIKPSTLKKETKKRWNYLKKIRRQKKDD
ncbi:MAG: hypothetical protein KatS3mg090_0392 [Patescibacteria group bacterium]|nr:MAG: hypothetical protein KatS3mg090_0392 [Patescibacteria group bacterium]